jgi:hypothetical protein
MKSVVAWAEPTKSAFSFVKPKIQSPFRNIMPARMPVRQTARLITPVGAFREAPCWRHVGPCAAVAASTAALSARTRHIACVRFNPSSDALKKLIQ